MSPSCVGNSGDTKNDKFRVGWSVGDLERENGTCLIPSDGRRCYGRPAAKPTES